MRSYSLGLRQGHAQRPHIEDRTTAAVLRCSNKAIRGSIKCTCLRCNTVSRLTVYVDIRSGHVLERAVAKETGRARWAVAVTGAGCGALAGNAA
jgi:hypothetical protein